MRRIGIRVRDQRLLLGRSSRDVAAASGVSSGHIARLERGAACPTVAMAKGLVSAVGLPWEEVAAPFVLERLLWDALDDEFRPNWVLNLARAILFVVRWHRQVPTEAEQLARYLTTTDLAPGTPIAAVLWDPSIRPEGKTPEEVGAALWNVDVWPLAQVIDLVLTATTLPNFDQGRYQCGLYLNAADTAVSAAFTGEGASILYWPKDVHSEPVRGLLRAWGEFIQVPFGELANEAPYIGYEQDPFEWLRGRDRAGMVPRAD